MNDILQKLLPMQPLASVEGRDNDTLMYLIHGLILILFVGWALYFIFVLIKFRERKGVKAKETHVPHAISSYIEWVVVVIEFSLLFIFSIPFWAVHQAGMPTDKNALHIKVVAQQFAWNVRYAPSGHFGRASSRFLNDNPMGLDPNDPDNKDNITTMNQIYIPINKTVLIDLTSKDVIHSFGVPSMRVKQDIIPGMTTHVWFTPNKLGQFEIACSQLCGPGHYRMRGIINVVSQADYDQWIQDNKGIHD